MNFIRIVLSAIVICLVFVSCEDDLAQTGSGLVGETNFNAQKYNLVSLAAKTEPIVKVQTNALSSYALGFNQDPVYGETSANILSQLRLSFPNPQFNGNPVVDSVVMLVPYFSRIESREGENVTYALDSLYGNDSYTLEIYRSNYFLRDLDPTENYEAQKYYSDQKSLFESNLESTPIHIENNFRPTASAVNVVDFDSGKLDTLSKSPRMKLRLPAAYFQQHVINKAGSDALLSNENFKNHFRGLYFKVKNNSGTPSQAYSLLNLRSDEAEILIYYHIPATGVDEEDETGIYRLKFGGQMVNVFDTQNQNIPTGQDLYLKGGAGSMAVIDLFTEEGELEDLRANNWLINEANLSFYVNESALAGGEKQPNRLFLYDLTNGTTLADYTLDITANDNNPNISRVNHLQPLTTEDGVSFYKLRITSYIGDLLNPESERTSSRLGLVLSNNVNVFNPVTVDLPSESEIKQIPSPMVLNPYSTVLYGVNAPEGKELKLEIFYTQPD
jgi:hypothetical protein